ncbi:MAG: 2-oxoglutarate and iron-dependent oxygenase domain-containing protein [Silicimonas sp.]|nr:2-oxoglutarate and iron-dependent oxygenase domain-containing protein [Silicimonas sp.]
MFAVPQLDIARFLAGNKADKMLVARELDDVCREVGFFCLSGHKFAESRFREFYDLSKAFFSLIPNRKRRVARLVA